MGLQVGLWREEILGQNIFLPSIVNLLLEVHALPLHLLLHDLLGKDFGGNEEPLFSRAFEAILVGPRPAGPLILPPCGSKVG